MSDDGITIDHCHSRSLRTTPFNFLCAVSRAGVLPSEGRKGGKVAEIPNGL